MSRGGAAQLRRASACVFRLPAAAGNTAGAAAATADNTHSPSFERRGTAHSIAYILL